MTTVRELELMNAVTRKALANKQNRYRAAARYPVEVARISSDLLAICNTLDHEGRSPTCEEQEAMDYMLSTLQQHFEHTFGHSMFANTRAHGAEIPRDA